MNLFKKHREMFPYLATFVTLGTTLVFLQRYRMKRRFPKTCRLVAMYIYPVKGFQAIEVKEVHCLTKGFQYDRRFMVTDSEGNFKTQRELPQMATVKCEINLVGSSPELKLVTKVSVSFMRIIISNGNLHVVVVFNLKLNNKGW
jgi:hypothetical protein